MLERLYVNEAKFCISGKCAEKNVLCMSRPTGFQIAFLRDLVDGTVLELHVARFFFFTFLLNVYVTYRELKVFISVVWFL